MGKMNKVLASVLCVSMAASAAACGTSGGSSAGGDNTEPVITGVLDQAIEAGTEFDALAGITASDAEDGDVTGKIMIESTPALDFKNGKATPENAGDYELVYSVTDAGGLTTEAYATLTVMRQTGEAVLYKDFDFTAAQTVDDNGWTVQISDAADATGELKEGAYVFDIVSAGEGDGDVQLVKSGVELRPADYKIKVWAKSTAPTYAHLLARDENASEWVTFGGAYNVEIGEEITPLELDFTATEAGSAEFMINLGKITPNPDEPSDTTPDNFTVTIDKIEIYEITGEETYTPVYIAGFGTEDDTVTVDVGDGAEAAVSVIDGAADVSIASYPTDGGVWSIKTDITISNVTIESGQKYYYNVVLTSDEAQAGECLVESKTAYDANRVSYNSLYAEAGAQTTINGTFTADQAVEDPVIRLQLGNPSEGVTQNNISIKSVEFGLVEGDKDTAKTIDSFMAFGNGTANESNADYPWTTFNGTDEDNDLGVGTIWTENGSLFYRIDQGGTTDWYNKLICGYTENPLVLEADSYYTVEITAKASKDVSCGFFLSPIGNWDPRISEGIDLTTEEQTFTFSTTDTFVVDMDFEMLFQFGSEDTANLGEVTIEISSLTISQRSVN